MWEVCEDGKIRKMRRCGKCVEDAKMWKVLYKDVDEAFQLGKLPVEEGRNRKMEKGGEGGGRKRRWREE